MLGQHDREVLQGIERSGIEIGASGVGKRVGQLEAGGPGPQREDERIAVLLAFRNGRGFQRVAIFGGGVGEIWNKLRTVGNVELKVVLIHLSAWRLGRVLHVELADDLELSLLDLDAHDVDDHFDALDLFRDVIDFDFDGSGAGRGDAVVGDVLMDGADQMGRLGVVELEGEVALSVGFGAAGFLHALAELEQDDFVSGGGLVGGGVLDRAGQGLGGGEGGEEEQGGGERNEEGRLELIATQRTRRGAVAPIGPSFGKKRLSQDDRNSNGVRQMQVLRLRKCFASRRTYFAQGDS